MVLGIPWITWIGVGIPFVFAAILPAILSIFLMRKRRKDFDV